MNRYRFVVVLLCAGVIAAVVIFGFSVTTKRRLDVAVAGLVAKGEMLLGNRPPKWAEGDRQDEATGPPDPGKSRDNATAAYNSFFGGHEPAWKDPSWIDVDKAICRHPNTWTDAERATVAAFMGTNREVILALRRLAESGGPVYELDYSNYNAIEVPHLIYFRLSARLLAADAASHAGDADYSESASDFVAGMKLADALGKEPLLISQSFRVQMSGYLYNAVEACMQGDKMSPELYGQIVGHMSNSDSREALARAFIGEGIAGLDAFERIRNGESDIIGPLASRWKIDGRLVRAYESPFARPWLNADEETFAEAIVKIGDAARLPYHEAKRLAEEVNKMVQALPRTRLLSRRLLADLDLPLAQEAAHEVRMDLLRIGLAVEQYRARNGAYPPALDAIAPILSGVVPLDPFSGKPYVYEIRDTGFVLCSADTGVMGAANAYNLIRFPDERPHGSIAWRGQR